jgi:hypothetical protein
VVLIKNEKDHLYLMNLWGEQFADKGFFRIENSDTLNTEYSPLIHDIFWTIDMLSPKEISDFEEGTLKKFRDLEKRLPPHITVDYICPLCNKKSKTNEIFGDLKFAKCPKCAGIFSPKLEHIDGKLVDLLLTYIEVQK